MSVGWWAFLGTALGGIVFCLYVMLSEGAEDEIER